MRFMCYEDQSQRPLAISGSLDGSKSTVGENVDMDANSSDIEEEGLNDSLPKEPPFSTKGAPWGEQSYPTPRNLGNQGNSL